MLNKIIVAFMVVGLCSTVVSAQETTTAPNQDATAKTAKAEKCSGGSCSKGQVAKAGECSECPISKAMASLPKMTYAVGTESTCCSKSAASLAEKSGEPIHYVVAGKTFEKKDEAFVSLVKVTEAKVKEFTTPHKCEKSGITTIAGKSCQCSVMAGQTASKVKAAVAQVKMTFAVGEETCNCPMKAAELAKTTGAKQEYVVAGEKTCCSLDARLKLAHAQYKAAVKATLVANTKPVDKVESTQTAAPVKTETVGS